MTYKLTRDGVKRLADSAFIPAEPLNGDWREYQEWLAAGNVPEPLETLNEAKARRMQEIIRDYARAMEAGFTSLALGSEHAYASDVLSQIKLAGATATDDSVEYECVEVRTGLASMKLHTALQMKDVLRAGKNKAVEHKKHLGVLTERIKAATTIAEVDAVVW